MPMAPEWPERRTGAIEKRRMAGMCVRCGQEPALPENGLGKACQIRRVETERLLRARQLFEARKAREIQEAKSKIPKREVEINGVVFIVQNSVVTASADAQIKQSPNPFIR
jgi:hypothetical protein